MMVIFCFLFGPLVLGFLITIISENIEDYIRERRYQKKRLEYINRKKAEDKARFESSCRNVQAWIGS